MRKLSVGITYCLAVLLVVFITGCGQEVVTVPSVMSTIAANGATNVAINTPISATFSIGMSSASLTSSTFTVTGPGGAAVSGAVTYSGLTATFTPATALAYGTTYTGTITTGATNPGGTPLVANYVWTFTTITPPPTVTATVPANGASNIPIGQVLSATFSEAMAPATIGATTFTVTGPGGTAVSGAVTYSGLVATFAPAGGFAYNTKYTATITTGATDLAGQPLTTNYVWTFTTITPAPTVIAVVPSNGAISVPINQALSATFSEAMNPATIGATTFTVAGPGGAVTGAVTYAGVIATFTPTTSLANNTLYTATITTGAQDLAGQPLASNYVSTFTTITSAPSVTAVVPANAATSVPIAQVLSATFSEAMSPGTLNAATFTVTAGGVTVPGAISYSGLVATFTPAANLAYSTTYTATITTGAEDLAGQPLGANYVWTFTTIAPGFAVLSTIPVNGATGVPLSQVLSATFNATVKCATITSTTFTITGPGTTPVAGTAGCSGAVATFTPNAALAVNTLYTATITTGAQSSAGTALTGNYVWSFLTLPATAPPMVISTVPVNGATAVPTNQALTATFSEAMTPATIDALTFTLTGPGATAVPGVVTYIASGSIATFTPDANLAPSTLYTATITTGAENLAGTGLASNYVWTFTTGAAPILVSPTVISTIPANAATAVPLNQIVSATFSTAMNPATINSTTFTLTGSGGIAVSGLVAYAAVGNTLTFTPAANLAPSTLFTATITTGVQNLAGTALASNYVWTFTTGTGTVSTPPELVSTVPANAASGVPLNQAVSATFTEAMNPLTITTATFQLTGPGGTAIAGTVSYDAINFIATFTPTAPLTAGSSYIATVTDGVTNLAGIPLGTTGSANPWDFSTGTTVVPPPPAVTATVPANGATSVPIAQVLSATFSEAMSPGTLDAATFTVTAGGVTVPGAISYSGLVATFTPASNLAYSTTYTATITTGAEDLAGTALAANYVWTFTTISPGFAVLSTIPVNGATGVPLSQVLSATFNATVKCASITSTTFAVTGPGTTPVTGTAGCAGTVATFTPNAALTVNTLYTATITTGAQSSAGTALTGNYVWSFLTLPATAPPAVISTVPVNGATGVPINQALTATFSEAMSPATIDALTFTLTGPGATAVTGVVTYIASGSIATFTPDANLAPSTLYTATITTGAENLAGTGLASNYVWTFTTAAAPILVPPTVISTIPANLATAVPLNQIVSATFSTAMNPATINSTTFTLTGSGGIAVSGLVAYAAVGNTLTFTPAANLTPSTLYTATITTGAQNLAGTALAGNYVWTFTTGTGTVSTPPELVSTVPANAATNVALNQAVSATFTEAMNPLTITTATFELTGPGGTAIAGTVSYDAINFIATFTPTAPLIAGSNYIATVTDGVTNLAGVPLGTTGSANPWHFSTGTTVVPPPVVLGPTIALFGGFGGGAGMTNQGLHTVINGDIGTTGASTTMTGFYDESVAAVAGVYPCSYTVTPLNMGLVNGTIDTAPPPPSGACSTEGTATTFSIATEAALEARTAYTTLQGLPSTGGLAAELGGTTIYPGVYTNASSVGITTGSLTLDAQGNPNATWVFQIGSSLTVGTPTAPESVILINGAQSGNVFWAVGGLPGAVINYGGGGTMVGTIISQPGITVSSPGVAAVTTINGRVIALNASVTIVNTVINVP